MAGEEKLTQVKIRQSQNSIKEIPISIDAALVTYQGQSLEDFLTNGGNAYISKGPYGDNDRGKILFINDEGQIDFKNVSSALQQTLRIPQKIGDLEWITPTVEEENTVLTYLKEQYDSFVAADVEDTKNGAFKDFYSKDQELDGYIDDLSTRIDNYDKLKIAERFEVLDKNGSNLSTEEKGIVYQNQDRIDALQRTMQLVIDTSDSSSEIYNLNTLTDTIKEKMDTVYDQVTTTNSETGQTQTNLIPLTLTANDIKRLKKFIQVENVEEVALGNTNKMTQKIAIWGSDANKIAMYVRHQENKGVEQYGMFVRENGVHVSQYTLKDNKWTGSEIYASDSYVFNQTINLNGGIYSGFVSDQSKGIWFFIPTPKSCVNWASDVTNQYQINWEWKDGIDTSCSIRTTAGGDYLQPSTKANFNMSKMKMSYHGYENGIRVKIWKADNTAFTGVTNNTPLSVYFHKNVLLTFTNKKTLKAV